MKGGWRWAGALGVAGAVWAAGCETGGTTVSAGNEHHQPPPHEEQNPPPVTHPGDEPDDRFGALDGASSTPDGGSNNPPPAELPVNTLRIPSTPGWEFHGVEQGGPKFIYGVTADEGGNLWVAGGEEGLFLLKPGETRFRRFTLADGLRPYGRMRDGVGGPPPGTPYLKAISVAGGPAGTVFVGYAGKPPAPGMPTCEDEWDQAYYRRRPADASIYKSGDADKVTLQADGTLEVVHYDIHTGPTKVRDELRGREKLCTIYRIVYDARTKKVFFGGNHGFAMGESEFDGDVPAYCFDPRPYITEGYKWEYLCAGLFEHVHPAINGPNGALLTDRYAGMALADNGDVFIGGALRTTRFLFGTLGSYWKAQGASENKGYQNNRFDLWPDAVDETQMPTKAQRKDDAISGIAVASDGTLWVSSYNWGIAHVRASSDVVSEGYLVLSTLKEELINYSLKRPAYAFTSSIAVDPLDGSVWAGAHYGGGITRLKDGGALKYGGSVFGDLVHEQSVWDIQVDRSGGKRRMLVGFSGYTMTVKNPDGTRTPVSVSPGVLGIYTGD